LKHVSVYFFLYTFVLFSSLSISWTIIGIPITFIFTSHHPLSLCKSYPRLTIVGQSLDNVWLFFSCLKSKHFFLFNYVPHLFLLLNLVYFLSLVGLRQNHVVYWTLTDFMWLHTTPFGKWMVNKYRSVCYYYRSFFHGTLHMWDDFVIGQPNLKSKPD
jgi:hypothetical protein